MAGERLAIQKLFYTCPSDTVGKWVEVFIKGSYRRLTAVAGNAGGLALGDYRRIDTDGSITEAQAQAFTIDWIIYAINQHLAAAGATGDYAVRKMYGTGTTPDVLYGPNASAGNLIGVIVEATRYDVNLDFLLPRSGGFGTTGFGWFNSVENTLRPVLVDVQKTDATNFGDTDGSITLTPSNGNNGIYEYFWADAGAPLTRTRTGLGAATYTCVVRDTSGVSTTVSVVIRSASRLEVLVTITGNNVRLDPSGGGAPYFYFWEDGPQTATRTNLPVGTYKCLVKDVRGASQLVTVVIEPYRFYWSKNPVLLALDAGPAYRLDPSTKPNLSFVCEVWVEEVYLSNEFVQVGTTQEQPADRDGRTVFDAQALLDSFLSEHLPAPNQALPSRADSLFRRFYFKSAQKFGTPAVAAPFANQQQNYVVFGGLDDYEAQSDRWLSYQAAAKPFLTWEPNDKKVLASQPEYLYFMVDSFELTGFNVYVETFFEDGNSSITTVGQVQDVRRYEVFCLPAGYQQLRLSGAVAWDVWVSSFDGIAQTERRRYRVRTDYVSRPRYFLYTNSLGGVNTLACSGYAKAALDMKVEESDRALGPDTDPLLGDTVVSDRVGVPV
ncbi:MAG TPA: hypothetical protein VF690_03015, partial [Hymenobacter sp.]